MTNYKGKYPNRIKSISGVNREKGVVIAETNNGKKYKVYASENLGNMPELRKDVTALLAHEIKPDNYLIDVDTEKGQEAVSKWFKENNKISFVVSFAISGNEANKRISANPDLQSRYFAAVAFIASKHYLLGFNQSFANADYPDESAVFIGGDIDLLVTAQRYFATHKAECGALAEQCLLVTRKLPKSDNFNIHMQCLDGYILEAYLHFGNGQADQRLNSWDLI